MSDCKPTKTPMIPNNKFTSEIVGKLLSCHCSNTVYLLRLINTITSGEWFNLRTSPVFIDH